MTVTVLWLVLMVPWVGLQCMIVVFPDHTHFSFERDQEKPHSHTTYQPLAALGRDTKHRKSYKKKTVEV